MKKERSDTNGRSYREIYDRTDRLPIRIGHKKRKKRRPKLSGWRPENKYLSHDPWIQLHCEIVEFFLAFSPTEKETKKRREIVSSLSKTVSGLFNNEFSLHLVGSVATETYLSNSDVDVTLVPTSRNSSAPSAAEIVRKLGRHLSETGKFRDVLILDKANVPIIKLVDRGSGIPVDISVNRLNAVKAIKIIQSYMKKYEEILPLLLVLKHYLAIYGLNIPYKGYLGSYNLFLLIVSMLQLHPSVNQIGKESGEGRLPNLGRLLVDFFERYSTFNYISTGISLENGGYLFSKFRMGLVNTEAPELPYIEDPCNPNLNCGKSIYNIVRLRQEFKKAYEILKSGGGLEKLFGGTEPGD